MNNIIGAIKEIYPQIQGGFSYWETRPEPKKDDNGEPILDSNGKFIFEWDDPIDGLVWENTQFEKPSWEQINAILINLNLEEELNNIKNLKYTLLESNYNTAQKIQIQNGHTFIVGLKGEDFKDIERQVNAAHNLGYAHLMAFDINGNLQVIPNIPYAVWLDFYETAKNISVNNLVLKTQTMTAIKSTTSIGGIDLIDINPFPEITSIILDL